MEKLKSFCCSNLVEKAGRDAADYAYCLGMVMRSANNKSNSKLVKHLPFTIVPSPVPEKMFKQALDVQKDFNLLMHRVSCDLGFVKNAFAGVLKVDAFTQKMYEIHENTLKKRSSNAMQMALIRADYMFDETDKNMTQLKQIEVNMIASSFGGCTDKIRKIHQNVLRRYSLHTGVSHPENTALHDLAKSLVHAWEKYNNDSAKILIVVTDEEQNIFDQRHLENEIFHIDHRVVFKRMTLSQINSIAVLTNENKLIVDGNEIAVVYYRAGYVPDNYPTEKEWKAREMMDQSNAINCPSVGYQLVGAKKMQQVLAGPGTVAKFINDTEAVERICDTFTGLYSLDMSLDGDKNVEMVMKNPEKFVLKPQLEGGGNNLYGNDIVEKLSKIGKDSRRCSYIVMDRVQPTKFPTTLITDTKPHMVEGVSELGVYGYILAKGNEVIESRQCGHLLRTKSSHHDDGGVASGVAVLDSPALI